jgi:disulfide bond formation protein DsbB
VKDLLPVDTMSLLFALLALVCLVAAVAIGVGALLRRTGRGGATLERLRDDLGRAALPIAWVVAVVTMLGSLYYSEVQGYTPCELCWYQRICAYPFVVILGIAVWRRDVAVRVYAVPVFAIGAAISLYHVYIQHFPPDGGTAFCTAEAPCTTRYVDEIGGLVSIPFMALAAFVAMSALLLVARSSDPSPISLEER